MRSIVITAAVVLGVISLGCGAVAMWRQPPSPGQRLALAPDLAAPAQPARLQPAQQPIVPVASIPLAGRGPASQPAPIATPRPPEPDVRGDRRPGRASPATPVEPAVYDVTWFGDPGQAWRTRIVISTGTDPRRRPAEIATRALGDNRDQVLYRATAFTAADGVIHIDARGAAIRGPLSDDWSPDSFAIHPDLSVEVMDDIHDPLQGHVNQVTKE